MLSVLRGTISCGLVAAACLVAGCQLGTHPPQTASFQAEELRNRAEDRKEVAIRQLAYCETGGTGPSERPIHGGGRAYLGRLQYSVQTVISYQIKKDGRRLSAQEAAELAHDYDRSAELAKYIIFDLEEPWHWPHCARKISLRSEIVTVKRLQAEATQANAGNTNPDNAGVDMAKSEITDPRVRSR